MVVLALVGPVDVAVYQPALTRLQVYVIGPLQFLPAVTVPVPGGIA